MAPHWQAVTVHGMARHRHRHGAPLVPQTLSVPVATRAPAHRPGVTVSDWVLRSTPVMGVQACHSVCSESGGACARVPVGGPRVSRKQQSLTLKCYCMRTCQCATMMQPLQWHLMPSLHVPLHVCHWQSRCVRGGGVHCVLPTHWQWGGVCAYSCPITAVHQSSSSSASEPPVAPPLALPP